MLILGNLTVNNHDIAMLVVWCIASTYNKRAAIMLLSLLIYTCIQALTTTDFSGLLITSILFFIASVGSINISSQFRKAFICFGFVYFIGAADQAIYYHVDFDTYFDRIMPYLVTVINAYLLAHLLSDGGKQGADSYGMRATTFCRRLFRLSLR